MKNAQTCLKSFNTSPPFHLLGRTFEDMQEFLLASAPLTPQLTPSAPAITEHHFLLSPWLCTCCSLSLRLSHTLIFPANNVYSSRAVSQALSSFRKLSLSSLTHPNLVPAVYTCLWFLIFSSELLTCEDRTVPWCQQSPAMGSTPLCDGSSIPIYATLRQLSIV